MCQRSASQRKTRCLTLVVPESRAVGSDSDRLVRIPVAIIEAWGTDRHEDPVLWIDNSAGDGFLRGKLSLFTENEPHSLNESRDVIVMDYRGTGDAEPLLDCPEVNDLNVGAFAADVDPTSTEGRSMRLDAVTACRARLTAAGIDLAAFASQDAAQDLDDLRSALGIDQWNMIVGEYGSKLAQILAHDHPATVRSVLVQAQAVPLQADWFGDAAANALRGWTAMVDACERDAGCAAAYPDLGPRLEALVTDLTANPRRYDEVALDFPGASEPFLLTASRLLTYVRWYTRAAGFFAEMPLSIAGPPGGRADGLEVFDPDDPDTLTFQATDAYAQPGWGLWEMLPQNQGSDQGTFALGAFLSSMCRDEAPFVDAATLAAAADVPLFGPLLGRDANLEACQVWNVEPAPPSVNTPAESSVPFLVIGGEYDTVSSPAWVDAFAEGLSNTTVVHTPGVGSMPTADGFESTTRTCVADLRVAFLSAPDATLDTSCIETATGPAFVLP